VLVPEDITLTGPDALLMASRLVQLGVDRDTRQTWYRDPDTGDTWLPDYLDGELPCGGVPRIRRMTMGSCPKSAVPTGEP